MKLIRFMVLLAAAFGAVSPSISFSVGPKSSIFPEVVRNNPMWFGLGGGALLFACAYAKIKNDYEQNQPVDERGDFVSLGEYVKSELLSLDYTSLVFWLKAAGVAFAGAGIFARYNYSVAQALGVNPAGVKIVNGVTTITGNFSFGI